jgi:predicted transcriptional regulator
MNASEIRALLVLKGISQATIADQLGVSNAMISQVIDGKRTSRRVQEAIADAMTSDRPYRRAHSVETTKEYLEVKVGSQLIGEVVSAFGRLIAKFD